jgi:C-terminal binding protein
MGVGFDKVDREALAKSNVKLCNVPDYGTADIADHAIGIALSLRRGIVMYNDAQRSKPAPAWAPIESPLISRLNGATFGILGLGAIGMAVAQRAKAFGWKVLFYDPFTPAGVDRSLQIERTKDIHELFERSTTLSVHCPLNSHTHSLIGKELLSLMPTGSVLINTARGEIVDLDAVEESLKDGTLAGVGLDVLPGEPIPEDPSTLHPLIKAHRNQEPWLAGRMVVTPHAAWHCPESLVDVRIKSAETMRDVLLHGQNTNVIAYRK